MKNRLISFAYMLPIIELLSAAIIMIVPTLRLFTRLKLMAHGSASVSLAFGEFVVNIPSDRFLSFAFDRAAWWAEGPITILNTPAKFVEPLVSLIVAREGHWWPRSLQSYAWHVFIYPIYALPAWIYIGFAIDAAIGTSSRSSLECDPQRAPCPDLRFIVLRIPIRRARSGACRSGKRQLVHRLRFCDLGCAVFHSCFGMDAPEETADFG